MGFSTAQQILTRADGGEKVSAQDRRHALVYLKATQPQLSIDELSQMFHVSSRMISEDRVIIREEKAKVLKDELSKDLGLVIADIAMDFEKQVSDLEKSKGKAKLGSKPYIDHCNSIFNLRMKMIECYQNIGYLPKNLGAMTVEKFEYRATVSLDGSVNTRQVEQFDEKAEAARAALNAEFIDVPQLENGENSGTTASKPTASSTDGRGKESSGNTGTAAVTS
jgi:hypothetical protein